MLKGGSAKAAASLIAVSKRFLQARPAFLASLSYQDALAAARVHRQMVTTTCDYLQSFGSYPRAMRPANAADIDSWLSNLINSRHFRRTPLCVRSVLNAGLGSELLNKLRLFQGASLSLLAAPGERTDELIAEIVRTLPPEVCLNLEFIDPPYTVGPANFGEKITEIAERISHIPQVGRPTSFKLDQLEDLCESPEAI